MAAISYWNNNGPFQEDYVRLYEALVPDMDNCNTVQGESLRAITKITYDYNNNGFGNNWSGAYNWLKEHGFLNYTEQLELTEWHRGRSVPINRGFTFGENDPIQNMLTLIMNRVIENIFDVGEDNLTPNTRDMYDLSESDFPYEEDDYDYEEDEEEDEEEEE